MVRLRDTVTDLTTRWRRIESDAESRRSVDSRRFNAAMALERARLDVELQEAQSTHRAAQEALELALQQRRQRLQKAQRAARKSALDRIEREEGRHRFTVQKGTLDTEREEKAALEANEIWFQEFSARLAEQRRELVARLKEASAAFRGYPSFRRALARPPSLSTAETERKEDQLLSAAGDLIQRASEELPKFRRLSVPAFFRFVPPWLVVGTVAVACAMGVWLLPRLGRPGLTGPQALGIFAAAIVVFALLHWAGRKTGKLQASKVTEALTRAKQWQSVAEENATKHHANQHQQIIHDARQRREDLAALWDRAAGEARQRREVWPRLRDERAARLSQRLEEVERARRTHLEKAQQMEKEAVRSAGASRQQPVIQEYEQRTAELQEEVAVLKQSLAAEWHQRLDPLFAQIGAVQKAANREFPSWEREHWQGWRPPGEFGEAVPFGRLEVDLVRLCGALPEDPELVLPGPKQLTLPLLLTFPSAGSLLIEVGRTGAEAAADTFNQILLRLLAATPPGKLNITIIDPVRLGQSFAGVMHLADFEENLINHRIWTQSAEIEQRLADLSAHMEKVIQMYLRNEYATIAEYNAEAGNIAEKYHFLVLADFPANFSDLALRRLLNIAASGARCGVYTLIHRDVRHAVPESVLEAMRQNSVVLMNSGTEFALQGQALPGVRTILDTPPSPELTTEFLRQVGTAGRDAGRVRVPFAQITPAPEQVWSLATTDELRAPIGRTGATKLQYLALGKGTRQHALVAGKTGSGKSTLFHVMINSLSVWYGPDQVEFFLVDFKKGVEFKCYASQRLPHARVVAIESDREFGLSVLQKVDDELRRRGDLFRQLGVQDLAGHHRASGGQSLPRAVLLIDEFQEFFVEDDRVSQTAAVLLDRIVRQGRAFGIHVVLGSQTLGGAYTLARTTLGQMVVRIALQCNEADALLIMDDTNPAPRLLTRPGEGIYNDMAGMVEGNSPFQTVWLDEQERDTILAGLRHRADDSGQRALAPFVFEGNAPALVGDNAELRQILANPPSQPPASGRLWLGAPNSIKGPATAELKRQSDHHLLVVGQREDAELAIVSMGLLGLAAQYPLGTAKFLVLDSSVPGSSRQQRLQEALAALPEPAVVGRAADLATVIANLNNEMKTRLDNSAGELVATFLFIQGLQHFKKLTVEDEFSLGSGDETNPASQFRELLANGPGVGIHVIATCDTYNNLMRCLGRKAVGHFGLRVLFQMSADDSSSLIDTPKANTLGLHRALLHHEQEGWLETFRPYALPNTGWVSDVKAALSMRPRAG
ncbi:MAG TPA: ATP-binding protein [Verrucomicrobiales bacterium]|nr:ATP-binding protein [Verrucomicrobiales bacterium]